MKSYKDRFQRKFQHLHCITSQVWVYSCAFFALCILQDKATFPHYSHYKSAQRKGKNGNAVGLHHPIYMGLIEFFLECMHAHTYTHPSFHTIKKPGKAVYYFFKGSHMWVQLYLHQPPSSIQQNMHLFLSISVLTHHSCVVWTQLVQWFPNILGNFPYTRCSRLWGNNGDWATMFPPPK